MCLHLAEDAMPLVALYTYSTVFEKLYSPNIEKVPETKHPSFRILKSSYENYRMGFLSPIKIQFECLIEQRTAVLREGCRYLYFAYIPNVLVEQHCCKCYKTTLTLICAGALHGGKHSIFYEGLCGSSSLDGVHHEISRKAQGIRHSSQKVEKESKENAPHFKFHLLRRIRSLFQLNTMKMHVFHPIWISDMDQVGAIYYRVICLTSRNYQNVSRLKTRFQAEHIFF